MMHSFQTIKKEYGISPQFLFPPSTPGKNRKQKKKNGLTIGSHHLYIFIAIISGQTRKKEKRVRLHLPKTGSSKTVILF